jgi:membrane-bound lytic murein transglycosylase B
LSVAALMQTNYATATIAADRGSQRGNQNMLSAVATLAYDCRRTDFFTEQLDAALKLIDRGALSASKPQSPQQASYHSNSG